MPGIHRIFEGNGRVILSIRFGEMLGEIRRLKCWCFAVAVRIGHHTRNHTTGPFCPKSAVERTILVPVKRPEFELG